MLPAATIARRLTRSTWAAARLGLRNRSLWSQLTRVCAHHVAALGSREVCSCLWALAHQGKVAGRAGSGWGSGGGEVGAGGGGELSRNSSSNGGGRGGSSSNGSGGSGEGGSSNGEAALPLHASADAAAGAGSREMSHREAGNAAPLVAAAGNMLLWQDMLLARALQLLPCTNAKVRSGWMGTRAQGVYEAACLWTVIDEQGQEAGARGRAGWQGGQARGGGRGRKQGQEEEAGQGRQAGGAGRGSRDILRWLPVLHSLLVE